MALNVYYVGFSNNYRGKKKSGKYRGYALRSVAHNLFGDGIEIRYYNKEKTDADIYKGKVFKGFVTEQGKYQKGQSIRKTRTRVTR